MRTVHHCAGGDVVGATLVFANDGERRDYFSEKKIELTRQYSRDTGNLNWNYREELIKLDIQRDNSFLESDGLLKVGIVAVSCSNCGWAGTVDDTLPDIDGEGSLGCPKCENIIVVK